jgi:hypothetical protein
LLNLATPPLSPPHCNTNIAINPSPTKPLSESTSPSQQALKSKTPSPQSPTLTPMELFHTPPTSPLPNLETLDDLSLSPPSFSLFDTIAQMETQQQPCEQLDDEPHHPSIVERLAYRYARPSIFPNDQGHTHRQSFVFHPIYKNLHGDPYGEPSFRHLVQPQEQQQQPEQQQPLPQESSQQFESLLSSYKKIEASRWEKPPNMNEEINTHLNHLNAFKRMVDSQINHVMEFHTALHSTNEGSKHTSQPSTFAPSSSTHPPPTNQTSLPPNFPRHGCGQCERTAHISEGCRRELRELFEEMRFILNHILDRLASLSNPPQH